jgi:hypothetical protein
MPIKASPTVFGQEFLGRLGQIAEKLGISLEEATKIVSQQGNSPVKAFIGQLLAGGVTQAGAALQDWTGTPRESSDEGSPTRQLLTGSGWATRLDPRILDVAGLLAPLAGPAARGAKGVGRMAGSAVNDAMLAGKLPASPAFVVKPANGNFLSGDRLGVDYALKPLRTETAGGTDPAETLRQMQDRWTPEIVSRLSPNLQETVARSFQDLEHDIVLNNWVDRNLSNYVKKQMATPEDPVRKLAEEGVTHMPPDAINQGLWESDLLSVKRRSEGFPENGMGKSETAKSWENLADEAIQLTAPSVQTEQALAANPWLSKLDPNQTVYRARKDDIANLRFDHIMDVLREDVTTGRIRPEQLQKLSMEQAVRRTYEYDQEMLAKMNAANAARREGLPVYKEYPEKFRWIQLNKPGSFAAESDAMGHSVRGYEPPRGHPDWVEASGDSGSSGYGLGGWEAIKSGRAKVYSLVDEKGAPHTTIEVAPQHYNIVSARKVAEREGLAGPEFGERVQELMSGVGNVEQRIAQIKGKTNMGPKDEYLPYVQDFVTSGKWSSVGDPQNAGMRHYNDVFNVEEQRAIEAAGERFPDHEYLTGDDIQRLHNSINPEGKRLKYDLKGNIVSDEAVLPPDGMAHGGVVRIADGGQPSLAKMQLELMQRKTPKAPYADAHEQARLNGVKMLGLHEGNTAQDRATAMGHTMDSYHGMNREMEGDALRSSDYGTLGSGIYGAPDAKTASNFAMGIRADKKTPKKGGNVLPLKVKMKQPFDDKFFVGNKSWQHWAAGILRKGLSPDSKYWTSSAAIGWDAHPISENVPLIKELHEKLMAGNASLNDLLFLGGDSKRPSESPWGKKITEAIKNHGEFDGIAISKSKKGFPEHVIFNPANIRSRFAAFDPARSHENDLMAADGGSIHMAEGGSNDDYRGGHTAPGPHFGAPMHDVSGNGMYPADFYGQNGLRYYADHNDPTDRDAYNKITRVKSKPNEMVWIHRAIPTSVYKEAMEKKNPREHMIRKGDWVAINKEYAKSHGESVLNGDYKIASTRVPAKHVWTNADSIHEWGYHPEEAKADGGEIHPTLAQMQWDLMRKKAPSMAGGGSLNKSVSDVIGKAAKSAGMKAPVTAAKNLTTVQDTHATLGDKVRQGADDMQNLVESMPFKYDKGHRVFTADSAKKYHPPYTILHRIPYGNKPMRGDHPKLGPGMGSPIKDATGKVMRTPYEPGYRVSHELGDDSMEMDIPESAIKGSVGMADGGSVKKDKPYLSWSINSNPNYDEEGNETPGENYALIDKLYVPESERKKGLGRTMIKNSLAEIQKKHPHLPIKVSAYPFGKNPIDMDNLVKFYQSEGFDVDNTDGHAVIMKHDGRKVINKADGGSVDDPEKTVKAYKLFRVHPKHPGKLFPLFVDSNTPVDMGKWVDAKEGDMSNGKVKSKIGPLAYRPGWHAGDLPVATHIGEKSDSSLTAPDRRPANHVWAEVEMPDDVDWQSEATKRGTNAKGQVVPVKAHITDQIPRGGHYRYKTNSNMTGNWLIGGSMKVNKVLSDADVSRINKSAGAADLPRNQPFNKKKFGFSSGGLVAPEEWKAESHVNYSDGGSAKSVDDMKSELDAYHGSKNLFPPTEGNPLGEFDSKKISTGAGSQSYGTGHYLTEAKRLAKTYAAGHQNLDSNAPDYDQKKGHVYHIRIPHEHIERMLDWDNPISEQHPDVQKAVLKHKNVLEMAARREKERVLRNNRNPDRIRNFSGAATPYEPHMLTGDEALYAMNNFGNLKKSGEEYLKKAGIPGIKYRNNESNDKTRNFVVFHGNEHMMKIVHKEAKGGSIHDGNSVHVIPHYKNGGSDAPEYVDPPSTKIQDWDWRKLPDVISDLDTTEVPDYIQKGYGGFMNKQLARAKSKSMTGRDFLKAYGITQSSIGRGGLPYATATKAGMQLPKQEIVRPEGAFSEWLGSKAGQAFLRAAESGDVDESAIADMQKKFSPFSMTQSLAEKLRWAVEHSKNNPDLASQFSTMPIDQYRDMMLGMRGIGPAKSGFIGSLLGRGDLPTFDTRQVGLHTGKTNKDPEFSKRMRAVVKGKPVAGTEAVDRLIARQKAMNLKLDPSLEPFRQHLTHHAVWDKVGNTNVTHGDVVKAMEEHKDGGKVGKFKMQWELLRKTKIKE